MTVDHHRTIVARLEDAGRTLMMLPMPARGMPGQANSAWPDYAQRYWDVFGHAEQDESDTEARREIEAQQINRTRIQASHKAVQRLDEVLGWLWYIQNGVSALVIKREPYRRVIVARMQLWPTSGRYVNSWRKLEFVFQTSTWCLKKWHHEGVLDILRGLHEESARK